MKKVILLSCFMLLAWIGVFAQVADSTKAQLKNIGSYLPENYALILAGLLVAYEVLAFAIPTWGNPSITKNIAKIVFVIGKLLDGFSEFFNRRKGGR